VDTETSDDLLERLTTEPEEDLARRWGDVTVMIRRLTEEIQTADRERTKALAWKAVLDAIAEFRNLDLEDKPEPMAPPTGASSAREVAAWIMTQFYDEVWDAPTLLGALARHGVETSQSNTRIILQRLAKDGTLNRIGHGRYRLAGSHDDDGAFPFDSQDDDA